VRGLFEVIVHGLEGPPKLAEDKTLYRGEGVTTPGERALIRVGDVMWEWYSASSLRTAAWYSVY
jgi:hypothetical protein